jgi:2-polyprenyl-3-methyl-5-hydroxy-6-metoxy-1,4-benzoquinol methylase
VYAPVYFTAGIRLGNLWNADSGYGRWNYLLKENLPEVEGMRILDLGANNGCIALEMLRHGAAEVIAVELNRHFIEQGMAVKEGVEWADSTSYNLRFIAKSMEELPKMRLGKFNLVTALCSMYYLDDLHIAHLVKHISTLTDFFVVQCNVARGNGRSDPETYRRASVGYNVRVLEANGFSISDVVAPRSYGRPLIVARKTS